MSETDTPPTESTGPFTGDRGWKGLERSPGETVIFAAVAVLLLAIVLAMLTTGLVGVGVIFVILSFVTIAVMILISIGQ